MQVNSISSTNFGRVEYATLYAESKVWKGWKYKNFLKIEKLQDKQESNPADVVLYNKDNDKTLRAKILCERPYYKFKKYFKKPIFVSPVQFLERMCKYADAVNNERLQAKDRMNMVIEFRKNEMNK